MPTTTNHLSRVATVIVPVANQEEALEFYTGTLGFEKHRDSPLPGGDRWVEVCPPGTTTSIAIMPRREGMSRGDVGFATADANAAHAALVAKGVDVDEAVMNFGPGVPPMFTFRDPDGNNYRVVEMPD